MLPAHRRRRLVSSVTVFVAPVPDRRAPRIPAPGLVVVGELSRASGLGEAARLSLAALPFLGVPAYSIDTSGLLPGGGVLEKPGEIPAGVPLLLHVNPALLAYTLLRLPRALLRGRLVTAEWAWELPKVPDDWQTATRFVHRLWAPSQFSAAALEPLLPGRVQAVPHPLAISPPKPSNLARADFGLDADAVVVLVSFNLASSLVRKNPLGAIAAFRSAFGDRADRQLVLKIGNPEHWPKDFAVVQAACAGVKNIRIIVEEFSAADAHALTACADIVLSLHRSEGFGLVPAEAMLMGVPVIATGWSGNMDFMDPNSAVLIGYTLIPARDPRGIYEVSGAMWAEPDHAQAVAALQRLAGDAGSRRTIGAAGRAAATGRLGIEPMRRALAELGIVT